MNPDPTRYRIYVDESSQSGCRYMVLGALVASVPVAAALDLRLDEVRDRHRLEKEMKWGRVSNYMLPAYRSFIGEVTPHLQADGAGYYAIVVDTAQMDHRRYNAGSSEIGFSKFVYQLLVKCGRLFQPGVFDCFLDDRTTKQTLVELRTIVNHGLNRHVGTRPVRRMEYRNSKYENLIQVVDVFTGAIAYRWNDQHRVPTANPAKVALSQEIATAVGLRSLNAWTSAGRQRFSIWRFAARPNRAPRRA